MSDRDLVSTGEYVVYPQQDHAEVIETVQVVAEDPTGDLLGFTADDIPAADPEAA